jgi:hypothetical protein
MLRVRESVRCQASLGGIEQPWYPRYAESNRGNYYCNAPCSEQMPPTKSCYHRAAIIISFEHRCVVERHGLAVRWLFLMRIILN